MLHNNKRYLVNFPGHMAECEFNYRRLCRLMPGWRESGHDPSTCGVKNISTANPNRHSSNIRPLKSFNPNARTDTKNNSWPSKQQPHQEWQYLMGKSPQEMAMAIKILDAAKYTTTVHIVVFSWLQKPPSWFKKHSGARFRQNSPDSQKRPLLNNPLKLKFVRTQYEHYSLDVRLYHDASVAEVITWQGKKGFQPVHEYPNPKMYQKDEKTQLNRFLGELLEFCLVDGRVNLAITSQLMT